MIEVEISGMPKVSLKHLVLDYNGTIAVNGVLIEGVKERLEKLSVLLDVHVLTADTYGSVHEECKGIKVSVHVIGKEAQDREKLTFIESLKSEYCVAIGNGRNDALMLSSAVLGFAIVQEEGMSAKAFASCDILFTSINDALDALLNPNRLIATLRN
ncbi:soluble P-type ATPase [Sulfuricurvum kujiense DSM 16994]|uniref:Soluble P-type ATPase n=1 Tax=Sulfuricurvum kujiense (strain ATCC BAA-921 / DSM 16994 / JCM 11577 / YK-1) TaxID=709032 RepID=E4U2I2_SULKY|nr:HAD family hydrolase [Sulfuricurvum kujiense]ADR34669.1 soluble P-type ATPase [Sulfuricurvum kujiense DSM 16994]